MTTLISGLLAGFSLIIAIGAQNAWVLRQGVRRDGVGLIVAICALSDLALIVAGTAGLGALFTAQPWLLVASKWAGAAYLLWFAYTCFRSAVRNDGLHAEAAPPGAGRAAGVVATTLALTWLNPHVYLDTVVLLGALANQNGEGRWVFAAGAGAASIIWFSALGFGARALAGPLGRPRTWQILDVCIGLAMLFFAVRLVW